MEVQHDILGLSNDANRDANMEPILPTTNEMKTPILLQHLVYGINQVTRRLESQTEGVRRPIIVTNAKKDAVVPLRCVLVCRDDIDPKILVDHIPHLVAAYNSTKPNQYVTLITLPKGSEIVIAQVLGVRRVATLGIDVKCLTLFLWVEANVFASTEQLSSFRQYFVSFRTGSCINSTLVIKTGRSFFTNTDSCQTSPDDSS